MIQGQRISAAAHVGDFTSDDEGLRPRYLRLWNSLLRSPAIATLTCRGRTAALVSGCLLTLAAAAQPHQVLLLTDTGPAPPAETTLSAHVRAGFDKAAVSVAVFAETLDNAGSPTLEHQSAVADLLRVKYAGRDLDAVLTVGPSSLRFLADRRDTLFSNSPIVYGAVRPTSVPEELEHATGVTGAFDLIGTVELALQLQPDARRLVVITGAGPIDSSWNGTARQRLEPYRERIEIIYLRGLTKATVLEQLRRLSPDTIVVLLSLTVDGAGELYVDQPGAARELAAASAAPLYVVYDTFLVDGRRRWPRRVVRSYRRSNGGADAAHIGRRACADLPPLTSTTMLSVDWPALRRWNLDERLLPPGTTVSSRGPTLWAQYRLQILGVASILILQTLLIVALLLYIRKRRVERTLRQTEARYHHVIEAQSDLICRYLPDTTLTFVNDAYCRYFGA